MNLLQSRVTRIVGLLLAAAIAVTLIASQVSNKLTITADFDRSTGIYEGSDVRILGVKVGKVTNVTPDGDHVRVTMVVTKRTDVPADAKAAIVAPSLVSGRYIQLAPVYDGGPKLKDNALIPQTRTAVPVEWDDIKSQLTRITKSFAPRSGQKDGSLSRFVEAAAGAFDGNGARINQTIQAMSDASQSLAGNGDNLYVTVSNLADFIEAMNQSGQQIDAFTTELASISSILGNNQEQLGALLRQSSRTVRTVRDFVQENRNGLDEGVSRITALSDQLVEKQVELANILHLAPTTVANFYNIYDPSAGTLTGRPAIAQSMGFANVICQAIFSAGGTLEDCQKSLSPLLDMFNMELPVGTNPVLQGGTPNQSPPEKVGKSGTPSATPTPPTHDGGLSGLAHLLLGGQ